jgi:hypothetical protein
LVTLENYPCRPYVNKQEYSYSAAKSSYAAFHFPITVEFFGELGCAIFCFCRDNRMQRCIVCSPLCHGIHLKQIERQEKAKKN